jgi:hypothetical protein
VGPQSLKPGLTVSFSAGAERSGALDTAPDCANATAVQSPAITIAAPRVTFLFIALANSDVISRESPASSPAARHSDAQQHAGTGESADEYRYDGSTEVRRGDRRSDREPQNAAREGAPPVFV